MADRCSYLISYLDTQPLVHLEEVFQVLTSHAEALSNTRISELELPDGLMRASAHKSFPGGEDGKIRWDHALYLAVMRLLAQDHHPQRVRWLIHQVLFLALKNPDFLKDYREELVGTWLNLSTGERDPRNLMVLFNMIPSLATQLGEQESRQVFDLVFSYFPLNFQPPPRDPHKIHPQELRKSLYLAVLAFLDLEGSCNQMIELIEIGVEDDDWAAQASRFHQACECLGLASNFPQAYLGKLAETLERCAKYEPQVLPRLREVWQFLVTQEVQKSLDLLLHVRETAPRFLGMLVQNSSRDIRQAFADSLELMPDDLDWIDQVVQACGDLYWCPRVLDLSCSKETRVAFCRVLIRGISQHPDVFDTLKTHVMDSSFADEECLHLFADQVFSFQPDLGLRLVQDLCQRHQNHHHSWTMAGLLVVSHYLGCTAQADWSLFQKMSSRFWGQLGVYASSWSEFSCTRYFQGLAHLPLDDQWEVLETFEGITGLGDLKPLRDYAFAQICVNHRDSPAIPKLARVEGGLSIFREMPMQDFQGVAQVFRALYQTPQKDELLAHMQTILADLQPEDIRIFVSQLFNPPFEDTYDNLKLCGHLLQTLEFIQHDRPPCPAYVEAQLTLFYELPRQSNMLAGFPHCRNFLRYHEGVDFLVWLKFINRMLGELPLSALVNGEFPELLTDYSDLLLDLEAPASSRTPIIRLGVLQTLAKLYELLSFQGEPPSIFLDVYLKALKWGVADASRHLRTYARAKRQDWMVSAKTFRLE